ncbi:D-alanine--D-alanine ligase, partial [Holdemanella sp. SCCA2]|nr:D-alanine--D-alanine ligase [Holdemanella sp. SCCA2]
MKIKVGVIFGGETVEHEVSIISAIQAMNNLDEEKYEIIPIYISKDRIWYTGHVLREIDFYKNFEDEKKYAKEVTLCKKGKNFFLQKTNGLFRKDITDIDIILPVVHGNNVEDGTLAGLLDSIGIPYVGSHVLGSALGQDKVVMKQVMSSVGIPVVDYTWFYDNEYLEDKDEILDKIKKLGYPVVVKPATLGSSVGITLVHDSKKIEDAIDEAINYDTKVVVEKAVENLIEVNASVLGNYEYQRVSPLEEVMGLDEILSYADKYLGNSKTKGVKNTGSKGMASTNRIVPARISDDLTKDIQETAKKVFKTLNLSGVCRIDFLIDKKANKFYVNEPNTCPGSLSFYLWKEANLKYKELL